MDVSNQGGFSTPNNGTQKSFSLLSREEIKQCIDNGMTDAQMARIYGVSTNQVYARRRQMNLVAGKMTSDQLADVVRLAESIKTLPLEAIQEIREIVDRYRGQSPFSMM